MTDHIRNFGRVSLGKSSSRIAMAAMRFVYITGRCLGYMDAEGDVWIVWVDSLHARRVMAKHPDWCMGTWTADHAHDKKTAKDIAEHIDYERLTRIAAKHRRAA